MECTFYIDRFANRVYWLSKPGNVFSQFDFHSAPLPLPNTSSKYLFLKQPYFMFIDENLLHFITKEVIYKIQQ